MATSSTSNDILLEMMSEADLRAVLKQLTQKLQSERSESKKRGEERERAATQLGEAKKTLLASKKEVRTADGGLDEPFLNRPYGCGGLLN